jgi:hypothetical protein
MKMKNENLHNRKTKPIVKLYIIVVKLKKFLKRVNIIYIVYDFKIIFKTNIEHIRYNVYQLRRQLIMKQLKKNLNVKNQIYNTI